MRLPTKSESCVVFIQTSLCWDLYIDDQLRFKFPTWPAQTLHTAQQSLHGGQSTEIQAHHISGLSQSLLAQPLVREPVAAHSLQQHMVQPLQQQSQHQLVQPLNQPSQQLLQQQQIQDYHKHQDYHQRPVQNYVQQPIQIFHQQLVHNYPPQTIRNHQQRSVDPCHQQSSQATLPPQDWSLHHFKVTLDVPIVPWPPQQNMTGKNQNYGPTHWQ
jgi:hypothetical protein